jgi:hypothetical protein
VVALALEVYRDFSAGKEPFVHSFDHVENSESGQAGKADKLSLNPIT